MARHETRRWWWCWSRLSSAFPTDKHTIARGHQRRFLSYHSLINHPSANNCVFLCRLGSENSSWCVQKSVCYINCSRKGNTATTTELRAVYCATTFPLECPCAISLNVVIRISHPYAIEISAPTISHIFATINAKTVVEQTRTPSTILIVRCAQCWRRSVAGENPYYNLLVSVAISLVAQRIAFRSFLCIVVGNSLVNIFSSSYSLVFAIDYPLNKSVFQVI